MSDERVILTHKCPVCSTATEEVYVKETAEIVTQSRTVVHYMFKKELKHKKPFDRLKYGSFVTLVCPVCGVLLSAEICEKEYKEEEYKI